MLLALRLLLSLVLVSLLLNPAGAYGLGVLVPFVLGSIGTTKTFICGRAVMVTPGVVSFGMVPPFDVRTLRR